MKKMVRIGAFVLGAVMLLGVSGCGDGITLKSPLPELEEIPVYNEEKTMWIGAWNNPPATEVAYQYLEDAGINMLYCWANMPASLKSHLDLAAKHGVKIYPQLSTNKKLLSTAEMNERFAGFAHEALGGFNYVDEPGRTLYDGLGELAQNHEQNFSDLDYYVNLYPSSFYYQNADNSAISYEQYVEEYCEKALRSLQNLRRILSFDHYSLMLGGKGAYLMENWLYTTEVIADYAKKYDATTIAFFLTTQHYNYLPQTYESLRYQANVYMAYGIRGFSHFTYAGGFNGYPVEPGTGIPVSGSRLYDAMKKLNMELLSWDDIYLAFRWMDTMQLVGSDNLEAESTYTNACFEGTTLSVDNFDFVERISATKDTLVGAFEDDEGNPALMVTNFDFPKLVTDSQSEIAGAADFSSLSSDVVAIKINGANRALIVRDGQMKEIPVENGEIKLELAASEGAFIIPLRLSK